MEDKETYARNGFRTTGIFPLNRQEILRKLPVAILPSDAHLVSPIIIDHLNRMRESAATNPSAVRRGKAVKVQAGKSVSLEEVNAAASATASTSGLQTKQKATRVVTAKKRLQMVYASDDESLSLDDIEEMVAIDDRRDKQPHAKRAATRRPVVETNEDSTSSDDDVEMAPSHQRSASRRTLSPASDYSMSQEDPTLLSFNEEYDEDADGNQSNFEMGSYVLVRFEGKVANKPYHYVGKLIEAKGKYIWKTFYY